MAVVTRGYGKRTYVQALARAAKHMSVYIVKHDRQLRLWLPAAAYTCVTGMVPCLNEIAALGNTSAP